MPEDRQPSIMRALGLAVGDLWRAVTGAPLPVRRTEVGRRVEEGAAETPAGSVIFRRTTIEEVEVPSQGDPDG